MSSALIFAPDSNPAPTGFIPLADTGYWAQRDQLKHEALLLSTIRFFQTLHSPLHFEGDWLEQAKDEFISGKRGKVDEVELIEQLRLVFDAFNRGSGLSVITGPPGAAKSVFAGLWAQLARAHYPDLPFILLTQEKTALDRLCGKMNIEEANAWTIDQALQQDWPQEAAIIIDEAGLLGTEILAQLLHRAQETKAVKVILIGDDKQFVSDTPGQPFRWLCQQPEIDCIIMQQSFRQKSPGLRRAVEALYEGNVTAALKDIPCQFLKAEEIFLDIRTRLADATPDKTFIVVHGPAVITERLQLLYDKFRVFSLAASQGLAMDRVIFLLAAPINKAELLVGCSRQRFELDILVDSCVYKDKNDLINHVEDFPQILMALDIIKPEDFLKEIAL